MGDRAIHRQRVAVRPRFRCLVCRRFVVGSEHGTCATCGWQPPTSGPAARRERRAPDRLVVALVVAGLALAAVRLLG